MDGYLQPPTENSEEASGSKMAPAALSPREPHGAALERIGDELRSLSSAMATKADLLVLTTTIQDALRAEMAGIRTEVAAQAGRIREVEHTLEAHTVRHTATDMALTRQARRALKPLTAALQERKIPYRWGFPFALLARHQNGWASARWPEEIPGFLEELGLPPIPVPDWVLGPPGGRPRPQRAPRRRGEDPPRGPEPRRRHAPGEPEQ
ncbi:Hypothetical predicted protein [Pelobates cultripes]|uniref:Uncharacterized protein n=1 Tax=Pelobates cultripes TaxID=61616 RepID=A0AAD1TLY6_PELCU|nr:Hypothetical predicted protein [Pelobates cultripes]